MAVLLIMTIKKAYLTIEYKRRLFTKQPINSLTDNSVERLKVNSIKRLLDNIIYKSNSLYANFYYLPFDRNESWVARRKLYPINDNIVLQFINGSICCV